MECKNCGCDINQAADNGAFFDRVNPLGELPAVWRCSPSCSGSDINSAEMLVSALDKNSE
jgi:hypothetical protein